MKLGEIQAIIELFENSKLSEFKYKTETGESLFLSKLSKFSQAPAPVAFSGMMPAEAAPVAAPAAAPTPAADKPLAETINSPIVGTFYRAANPTSEPFVKVGQSVSENDVVCIVEAMKVMNQIKAEKSGVIKAILLKDGDGVQYGQPLFELE